MTTVTERVKALGVFKKSMVSLSYILHRRTFPSRKTVNKIIQLVEVTN